MKILDRYILTTYLKTFMSVFLILMFIFVLQAIWLYIGDLAGKDLDTFVIIKLLLFITPTLIPLILPLTILLVSIMVFGQFAENYEFAAMKSTGISLQRAMKSLSVFIVLLGIITFFFSNNVIPRANFNVYNLRKNIAKVKPALAISKGQFNEIGDYNIKVEDKTGENGQYLEKVVIHKKAQQGAKNRTVIVSESGELKSSENSNILQLVLYNGNYYEEIFSKKAKQAQKKPHAKSYFEEYTINVDLEGLNDVDLDDQSYENRYNMLNVNQLNKAIDSLYQKKTNTLKDFSTTLYNRTSVATLNNNISPKKDSIYKGGQIIDLFKDRTKVQLLNLAGNTINSTKQIITTNKQNFTANTKWRNKHVQALHEKYVLGIACIILFFVGAPLGALIRKGGIGLPLVIAILLFLTYHFIGLFAKNSSLDDSLNPVLATWLSTLIMLPLSIYLTRRATKDRPLFESEGLLEPLKQFFGIKSKTLTYNTNQLPVDSEAYMTLNSYDNTKLIDVLKHYRKYDYGIEYKNSSLAILNSRGITQQELKFGGNLIDYGYEEALRLKYSYEGNSKLAFILYLITLVLILPGAILKNNGFPTIGQVLFVSGIIIGVLYLFALIKSFIDHSNLYKQLEKKNISNAVVFLLIGLPLYILFYFYQKQRIKEDLKVNSIKDIQETPTQTGENTKTQEVSINHSKLNSYKTYANFALIFYGIGVLLFVLYFVFKNNKLPAAASASIELSAVSGFIFLIYTVVSSLHFKSCFAASEQRHKPKFMLWTIISFVLYPVVYIFRRNKIAAHLSA
ncbi:LptF/LptG family permease [Psychroserpens sp. SPM9]|uniref:LptF/LptG family permease n=1 Tax=Psychroserpens sp. SPM9 TaxID=2975598 RepID=UPI0021A64654|nr:LptF/LptG family permease [Psychroserpens sp. SPM9]MDG5491227.1 LptF/LptG family permease [Psychroserpens sp. SPM9]